MTFRSSPQRDGGFIRVLQAAIHPNADAIAEIALDGDIAVVYHEVRVDTGLARSFYEALGGRGWPVVRLARRRADRLFATADERLRRWALTPHRSNDAKIFVVVRDGNLLVNYAPDAGYSLEPSSLRG